MKFTQSELKTAYESRELARWLIVDGEKEYTSLTLPLYYTGLPKGTIIYNIFADGSTTEFYRCK